MTATPPPLEVMVGVQVKALRLAMGMTLSDLSAAASLSARMLSQIENGQTSPSPATLQALASALNIPIGSFFKAFDEKRDASFVRTGEGLKIERRGSSHGHRYEPPGHGVRGEVRVEPFLITLDEADDGVAMSSEFRAIARLPGVGKAKIREPEPGRIHSWSRAA